MVAESTRKDIESFIEYLISNSTAEAPLWNMEKIRSHKPNRWNYIDGCMMTAELSLYECTKDRKYLDACDAFVGWFVNDDGTIKTYDPEEKNLDNINMGRSLFDLYRYTGKEKYKRAIYTVRHQLDIQPRTASGNFWHKEIYPNQVWLDGLYMAQPFYIEFENRFHQMRDCADSFCQFQNVWKNMRDPKTGLYYHGFDESRKMYWADPETGCSRNFWLRALGWFVCALTDSAALFDEQLYYEKRYLGKMLKDLVDALVKWQDGDGLFYQLVNLPDLKGNYEETSGTALIAYGILKAVRLGILPERYAAFGERAMDGLIRKKLIRNEDHTIGLDGICLVAGLGGKNHRDGSAAYYLSEPVVKNDAKGTAPFILAYTELLRRER
jgi:unsaturated rhamnogalacturonyl hydrolase